MWHRAWGEDCGRGARAGAHSQHEKGEDDGEGDHIEDDYAQHQQEVGQALRAAHDRHEAEEGQHHRQCGEQLEAVLGLSLALQVEWRPTEEVIGLTCHIIATSQ